MANDEQGGNDKFVMQARKANIGFDRFKSRRMICNRFDGLVPKVE